MRVKATNIHPKENYNTQLVQSWKDTAFSLTREDLINALNEMGPRDNMICLVNHDDSPGSEMNTMSVFIEHKD